MFNFAKSLFKNKPTVAPVTQQTAVSTTPKTTGDDNKLSLILSAISEAIIALDPLNKIVFLNPAAEKLIGATTQDTQNKPITQIVKFFQDNIEVSPCQTENGAAYQKESLKFISFKNKQGIVNINFNQIKEGNKENLSSILTLHDVTERKSFEDMKLDFVSMAAHELRTPITSIKGYLSVFMNENKDKFDAEQNTFLTRISISIEQLLALVENLLNVSKIERGIFNVNTIESDWVELVKQTFDQFAERAKEKNLEFDFIQPTTVIPKIMVDKLRIVEVISNLISNAIAYTPPGGKIKVWIETSPDKASVITHITDTGEGIPKEAIQYLFTKFFRVKSGKLEQGTNGTGLGLYISREITQMHHGKIWVDSELGKGSTFSFSLPINLSR